MLGNGWVGTRGLELATKILAALESIGYEKLGIETSNGYINLTFKIRESDEKSNV